jgi:hypothetical protein
MIAAALTLGVVAQGEETGVELPAEPWVLGAGVFAALVVLLIITLQFNKDR